MVDFGVPIIDVLDASGVEVSHSGTKLEYPPQLIKGGTERTVQMLFDGEPSLSAERGFVTAPLVDVKVIINTPDASRGGTTRAGKRKPLTSKQKRLLGISAVGLVACIVLGAVLANAFASSIGFSRSATTVNTSASTEAISLKGGDRLYFSGHKFRKNSAISFWICTGSTSDSFCYLKLYDSRTGSDGKVSGSFDLPKDPPVGKYFIRVQGGTTFLSGTLYQDVDILPS